MMKHFLSVAFCVVGAACGMSQTTPVQSSQPYPAGQPGGYNAVPQPAYNAQNQAGAYNGSRPGGYNANQAPSGGVMFSNQVGQSFSAQDLAAQLENLRGAIDQTLPILTAFNESYSNSNSNARQTVGSALSGLVSDVLHRNQTSSQGYGENPTTSNLLSVLHGLLNKNSNSAAPATAPNPQDLVALQTDLQPVLSVLQRLNVSGSSNQISAPYPNRGLTPTGR